MLVALLITPLARGAYFADVHTVARAELRTVAGVHAAEHREIGGLDFLVFEAVKADVETLARLSVTQGLFQVESDAMRPLEIAPPFQLPDDLVFGTKYQGKTHELVTQLAINLAATHAKAPKTLFDPMAGQGSTLLWALRYGFNAKGIERDSRALEAIHRHVKRQTKLHRIKHEHASGYVGQKNKEGDGRFERYTLGGHTAQLVTGDTREASRLLSDQRFDMVVSDLPYGVRFKGSEDRSPLDTLRQAAPVWVDRLRPGGAMALIHNTYQPETVALEQLFTDCGLDHQEFSAPHRMSESIVRDVVVFTKPS